VHAVGHHDGHPLVPGLSQGSGTTGMLLPPQLLWTRHPPLGCRRPTPCARLCVARRPPQAAPPRTSPASRLGGPAHTTAARPRHPRQGQGECSDVSGPGPGPAPHMEDRHDARDLRGPRGAAHQTRPRTPTMARCLSAGAPALKYPFSPGRWSQRFAMGTCAAVPTARPGTLTRRPSGVVCGKTTRPPR